MKVVFETRRYDNIGMTIFSGIRQTIIYKNNITIAATTRFLSFLL